ncbi:MAG: hypothetical protein KME20_18375 [Kaiparowitsia implicata GSE-PSE-MK54-09C]|jgi:hypothetical protein|nr:hypothetical protein [Kaiparowitsia implicata GSE-PSE-MK54-09C]
MARIILRRIRCPQLSNVESLTVLPVFTGQPFHYPDGQLAWVTLTGPGWVSFATLSNSGGNNPRIYVPSPIVSPIDLYASTQIQSQLPLFTSHPQNGHWNQLGQRRFNFIAVDGTVSNLLLRPQLDTNTVSTPQMISAPLPIVLAANFFFLIIESIQGIFINIVITLGSILRLITHPGDFVEIEGDRPSNNEIDSDQSETNQPDIPRSLGEEDSED